MTEQEWLTSTDPQGMLDHLLGVSSRVDDDGIIDTDRRKISDRKLRLFACGCCRQIWDKITDEKARKAVETGEQYADGKATKRQLRNAFNYLDLESVHDLAWIWSFISTHDSPATWLLEGGYTKMAQDQELAPSTQAAILRDVVGNPWQVVPYQVLGGYVYPRNAVFPIDDADFSPVVHPVPWSRDRTVLSIAHRCYEERGPRKVRCLACSGEGCSGNSGYLEAPGLRCDGSGFKWAEDGLIDPDSLAVLADALEEAGCDSEELLKHLRGQEPCWLCGATDGTTSDLCSVCGKGTQFGSGLGKATGWAPLRSNHVLGCWALDLILGKE